MGDAMSFFSFKASKSKMSFPQPGFLEGVKSKGKPLMKMANCEFTYPGNQKPTNHLDVINVKWVMDYFASLTSVTCVMVSHDTKFLDTVCSNILRIQDLKLKAHKGNLSSYVEKHPDAMSFFSFKASRPLTKANVEQHLGDVGLEAEYATHTRISALSGGQKVKVVLA